MKNVKKCATHAPRRVRGAARRTEALLAAVLLFAGLHTACDRYPGNLVDPQVTEPTVTIECLDTAYVPAVHEIDGLEADKANVMTFSLFSDNVEARAIEVHGKVIIDGPPYQTEQAFTFRTDSLLIDFVECPFEQQVIQQIDDSQMYVFTRSILPPNDYYPFEGEQGKIDSIIINNVYAIWNDGSRHSLSFAF